MNIISKIVNKIKDYIETDETQELRELEFKPKKNKDKMIYNKHGFPTYNPRLRSDSSKRDKY
jgi:hypothetical protein